MWYQPQPSQSRIRRPKLQPNKQHIQLNMHQLSSNIPRLSLLGMLHRKLLNQLKLPLRQLLNRPSMLHLKLLNQLNILLLQLPSQPSTL